LVKQSNSYDKFMGQHPATALSLQIFMHEISIKVCCQGFVL
jgi:hypothetical protein